MCDCSKSVWPCPVSEKLTGKSATVHDAEERMGKVGECDGRIGGWKFVSLRRNLYKHWYIGE